MYDEGCMGNIIYKDNAVITVEQAIALYKASTLGERRPIDRPDIFAGMLKNTDVLISAWHCENDQEILVGISRTLTDFTYVAYLADLAVDVAWQKQGIGKRMIEETRKRLGKECAVVLLAAPKANDYYVKLGFEHNPRAWVLNNQLNKNQS
jgi:GNAT superfamily N-acetyltransferase